MPQETNLLAGVLSARCIAWPAVEQGYHAARDQTRLVRRIDDVLPQLSGILQCPRRDAAPIMSDKNLSFVTKMIGQCTHNFDQKLQWILVFLGSLGGQTDCSQEDRNPM